MRKLKILGHEWAVKKTKIPDDDGYSLFGQTIFRDHKILLDKRNCRGQDTETLLHEIFHIVSCYTASHLSERQVTALSNALHAVLKDNKMLKT